MNILFISQYLSGGGLERMVQLLGFDLSKRHKHKVFLFAFDGTADKTELNSLRDNGINATLSVKSNGFSFKTIFQIARLIRKEKIDILHTHESAPLIYTILARALALKFIPVVHTQHSFVHLKTRPFIKYYDRFFQQLASRVCVVSTQVKEEYVKLGANADDLAIVDNGVEFPSGLLGADTKRNQRLALSRGELQKLIDSIWLVSIARIHNRKGQSQLIALWNALSDETRKKSVLLFVGPVTDEEEYKKLLLQKESSKNKENIFFVGASNEPTKWLQVSDFFLSGSEYEGMPLAPLEAAGAGIPSILSDIPGHSGFVQAEKFKLNDPNEGALIVESSIRKRDQNVNQFYQDCWNASANVRDKYGFSKMTDRYLAIYKSLL